MARSLFQRRLLFNRRWFEITSDGLIFRKKEITGSAETFTLFEDIGSKTIRSTERKRGWLIATLFFLVLATGMFFYEKSGGSTEKNAYIIYFVISAICAVIYLVTSKNLYYLLNSETHIALGFYPNNPSVTEFNNFIDELKLARKQSLLKKHGELSKLVSYDQQLTTLKWLEHIEVLTAEEFDAKIKELKILFNPDRPVIGFQTKREN